MKKHTRRKFWPLINPLAHVLEGIAVTPDGPLNLLRARELTSLEALSKGRGGLAEWNDMTDMLNIAETMALVGVGPEVLPACEAAQAELIAAAQRFERTRVMGLTATGLAALRELYAFHDLQRASVTRGEYEKFIARTVKRIRSGAHEVLDVSQAGALA